METADEVVEVAKEVEEELKIETENEQEEREEKKAAAAAVEDGMWEEEGEGEKMKGVEEPVREEEMVAPKEEDAETVAEEVKEEEEGSKEMEVETPSPVVVDKEEEPAAAVEPEPEPKVVEEEVLPAGPNVEVVEGKYTIVTSGYRYSPANFWFVLFSPLLSLSRARSKLTIIRFRFVDTGPVVGAPPTPSTSPENPSPEPSRSSFITTNKGT